MLGPMLRCIFICMYLGIFADRCCAQELAATPVTNIHLPMVPGDADVVAYIGDTTFPTLADLENLLTKLPAGSKVKLSYYAGNILGLLPESKVPGYVAARKLFCAEHHLDLRIFANRT